MKSICKMKKSKDKDKWRQKMLAEIGKVSLCHHQEKGPQDTN
uniref:Uncharacterized protein n=1 Tax=Rhizophora mucronata TaxID=61149 RepID=A0A2P2N799_RHIMU